CPRSMSRDQTGSGGRFVSRSAARLLTAVREVWLSATFPDRGSMALIVVDVGIPQRACNQSLLPCSRSSYMVNSVSSVEVIVFVSLVWVVLSYRIIKFAST